MFSFIPTEETSVRTKIFFKAWRFLRKKVFHKKMSKSELEADRAAYIALNTDTRFAIGREFDYICRDDKYANNGAGIVDTNYFIQDIWGARKVCAHKPLMHYDIGSSVAGFIAHLLGANQRVTLIDIRPLQSLNTRFLSDNGGGVTYLQADATNLSSIADSSVDSISALCSIEHFGLGRYGDPIDPMGWEKALLAFERVLRPNGKMFISVPVGKIDKVCFNAHRVFRPETIINTLQHCQILEMSYIQGLDTIPCIEYKNNQLITHQDALDAMPEIQNWGATGLFEFIKKDSK